ncbi:MAG: hypothetical protein AAF628_33850 [Planctomycetota bacterium]
MGPLLLTLLAFLLTGSLHAQRVRVVRISGGTPYQQIQPAIDAADVVQVDPGVYQPFSCNKPLRIEGGPAVVIAETPMREAIRILGIPAGTTCSVSELALRSPFSPCICEPVINVDQCASHH